MPHLGQFAALAILVFIFKKISQLSIQGCPIITQYLLPFNQGVLANQLNIWDYLILSKAA
jgi:hypothetical protein